MTKTTAENSTAAEEKIGITQVSKRDGTLAPFDSEKIFNAINKAGLATKEFDEDESRLLTAQVLKVLKHKLFQNF